MEKKPIKLSKLGEAQVIGRRGMLELILVRTPRTLKWFRVYPEVEGEEDRNCWLLQKEKRFNCIHLIPRINAALCSEHGFKPV